MQRFFTLWSIAGVVLLIVNAFLYLMWNGFLDHGEITMTSVSWLFYHGHPLYTALDAPERYSLEHGPMVYLLIGGMMELFGPNFHTAKLANFLVLLAIIFISWRWFCYFFDRKLSFWLTGLESWLLAKWYFLGLVRDDGFMLLCTLLSLYFVTTRQKRLAVILGVAIPLGLLVNFKIHETLCALPILVLIQQRFGWRDVCLTSAVIAVVAAVPFLLPNISLFHYIQWLEAAVSHGISLEILRGNLAMVVLLASLPLVMGRYCQGGLQAFFRRYRSYIVATGISVSVIALVGAKNGSGSYHLAPLMPLIMYLLILIISSFPSSQQEGCSFFRQGIRYRKSSTIFLVVIFLTITLGGINGQKRLFYNPSVYTADQAMVSELHTLQAKYQGQPIMIGYGDKEDKIYNQWIPWLVFSGNPYFLDIAALEDMGFAGMKIPEATINTLKAGDTAVWLLPRGSSPFAMYNAYERKLVFDQPFRQAFCEYYQLTVRTQYFDVWLYSGKQI